MHDMTTVLRDYITQTTLSSGALSSAFAAKRQSGLFVANHIVRSLLAYCMLVSNGGLHEVPGESVISLVALATLFVATIGSAWAHR